MTDARATGTGWVRFTRTETGYRIEHVRAATVTEQPADTPTHSHPE